MKYKAKKSYRKLSYAENYCAFGSASSHSKLMAGESIEKVPPKELMEYLEEVGIPAKKKKQEGGNK